MIPEVFRSPESFNHHFALGLKRQISDDSLGAFILAWANACFEEPLWTEMRDAIQSRFEEHAVRIGRALQNGSSGEASDDDLMVFLKLLAIGFAKVGLVEQTTRDGWEIQYNLLRGLRPARLAEEPSVGIQAPFDPQAFNFNRPFLARELFWSGTVENLDAHFFYNKFPFVPGHLLFAPRPADCLPQMLTSKYFHLAWRTVDAFGSRLPGLGLGYNSYGACASVNHLHFQLFLRESELPAEASRWRHNGGDLEYPATCLVVEDAAEGWHTLQQLHQGAIPYNLLLRPGRMYLFPRDPNLGNRVAPWSAGGHAWYEMAGAAVVTRRETFNELGAEDVDRALGRASHS